MDEVKKYWRDKVTTLLQWGAAVFILLVGWAIQNHQRFSFSGNPDNQMASYSLLVASLIYAPLLPLAIRYIYKRFLVSGVDETVLPYRFAMICALVLSALTLMVATLVSATYRT